MTKYSPAEIAALLALQEKATPGPWVVDWNHATLVKHANENIRRQPPVAKCDLTHGLGQAAEDDRNNTAFIASAHSLADQLRAAQAIIERQRAVIHEVYNDCIEGFVRCTHCGWQEDTKDLDFMDAVTEALSLTEQTNGQ